MTYSLPLHRKPYHIPRLGLNPTTERCSVCPRRASAALSRALSAMIGVWLCAASPTCASAGEAMLHAADGAVLDRNGAPVLLRCVNLSPWLVPEGYLIGQGSLAALTTSASELKQRLAALVGPEKSQAFWRRWTDAFLDAADFQRLKSEGFNCVRLPLNAKFLASRIGPDAVVFDPTGIAPVDAAVAWGATYGIYVILDLHDAPGGQNPLASVSDVPSTDRVARLWTGGRAAENQQKTVALWRAIAARYAKADGVGGYDLLNEPELPAERPTADLAKFYDTIIAAIRAVDRSHMIVIEGNHYAHDFSALRALSDENLMYEFHEYAIFNSAWRTPTQDALKPFLELRSATHRPLWLGEFGEESFDWQRRMVGLMKSNDIGWAIWPWKRIDLGNGHPVAETIAAPAAWKEISGYLVGRWFASKPSANQAELAISQMLSAARTANCREDAALIKVLAGN